MFKTTTIVAALASIATASYTEQQPPDPTTTEAYASSPPLVLPAYLGQIYGKYPGWVDKGKLDVGIEVEFFIDYLDP